MDKKQADFEEAVKRNSGTQMVDATEIANAAIFMISNRSEDLSLNALIPFLLARRLIDKNVEHLKESMLNSTQLQMMSLITGENTQEVIDRIEIMTDNMVKVCAKEQDI